VLCVLAGEERRARDRLELAWLKQSWRDPARKEVRDGREDTPAGHGVQGGIGPLGEAGAKLMEAKGAGEQRR
jgi:hypothetical protein